MSSGLLLLIPPWAQGGQAAVDANSLGLAEGMIKFCQTAYPAAKDRQQQRQRFMIRTWPWLAKLASSVFFLAAVDLLSAQEAPQPPKPAPAQARAPAKAAPESARTSLAKHVPMQAQRYYEGVWGVDSLTVKYTESGEIIRFSYRVLDAEKAAVLNDKGAEPSLIDPQAGVKLVVPQMEKIGQLRQSSTPIPGKQYWMAFSNSGRRVRPGHRVDVQVGGFHAEGLVVE
jgi:hypothetical protein